MLAAGMLVAFVMYKYTINNAVPVYSAYTELYVNTRGIEEDKYQVLASEGGYTGIYIEILRTVQFGEVVYENLSDEYKAMTSPGGISGSLNLGRKNGTAIIVIRAYSVNSALAKAITEAAAHASGLYLNEKFGVSNVEIVEPARFGGGTTVEYKRNVVMGFIFGAAVVFLIVFLRDMYDYRVKSSDEITQRYNLPVLGIVPTFDSKPNAGNRYMKKDYRYKYKYGKYKR